MWYPFGSLVKVHASDEGILQSMLIEGAPWDDNHHRSLPPEYEKILKVTYITLQYLNS